MSDDTAPTGIVHDAWGQTLLHSLGDGLVIADQNGNVVFMNRPAEEILSVALDDIRGRSMDHCHRCPWKVRQILDQAGVETPYRAEISVGDRWLSITATHLRNEQGGNAGYAMTVRDTTERYRLEAALKQSNLELSERQEKLDLQIELARTIQKALMPGESADFPGARIRLWNSQSQIVGGDVMFLHEEEDGGWLMLGDIMGKGLFASQFVPLLHGFIRDGLPEASSPADLLGRLNAKLINFIADRFTLFITMICLRWNNGTRTLQIASAGNENPYLIEANGHISEILLQSSPIGLGGHDSYVNMELPLPAGSRILCYSDGVKDIHKTDSTLEQEWIMRMTREWISAGKDPFRELVGYLKISAEKNVPPDDQSLMMMEV